MTDRSALARQLEAYLAKQWSEPVKVSGLRRFHGGAGRETFRFDAAHGGRSEGLVLRRDPAKSIIETERGPEFRVLRMFAGTDVPAPEPLFLETSDEAFGAPGFIMREVRGEAHGGFDADPFGDDRERVGRDFFTALGRIAAADPAPVGLAPVTPRDRVQHWLDVIEEDAVDPEPVAFLAADHLLATAPPPVDQPTVVHGDYRRGNFLVFEGRITAVLDWEMVHVGDPLEDLAWACDELWAPGSGRAGGMVPEAEAIRLWQEASGRAFDADRYRWWKMFAEFMGLAIWISSAAEIVSGRSHDPVVLWAALFPYRFHNHALAGSLREALA